MRTAIYTTLLALAALTACTSATAPTARDCSGGGVMSGSGTCH